MELNSKYHILKSKRDTVEKIMESFQRESNEMKERALEYKNRPGIRENYLAAAQHKTNKANALQEAIAAMDEKLEKLNRILQENQTK